MNKLAAQLMTTLYVFGQRLEAREERGQTTAEYVGIVAFVALLVVAIIGLSSQFSDTVKSIIDSAFNKIKSTLG